MPRDLLAGIKKVPRDLLVGTKPFEFGGGRPRPGGAGGAFEVPETPLERRIAERPDMMEAFVKELAITPKQFTAEKFRERPIRTQAELGIKPIATIGKFIGGGVQRGLGAVANVAMALQDVEKRRAEGIETTPTLLAKEAWKGITGEKLGELGDIARKAGWPELLSSTLGLLSSIGITNLATKGKLVEEIGRAKKIVTSKIPKVMDKDYVMRRTEQGVKLLKDTRKTLGTEVGEAVKKVANKRIRPQVFSQRMPRLPQKVLNAFDDPIYGIEKLPDGSYKPTVGNLNKMKEALDDFMTTKTWEEAGKKSQRLVKQAYGLIRKTMGQAAPGIEKPMASYSKFMGIYRDVNKTLQDTSGRILEKKLRGAFRPGAERQYQIAWEKFGKIYPQAGQIVKDVVKFNKRQAIKALGKKALFYGAGIEGARRFLVNPLLRSFGEESGGGYEGGGY